MDMIELRTAHTADLDADAKAAVRRLLHGGRALRTGYVEGVAVRADRCRRGHSAVIMAALERVVRSAYQLVAFGASAEGSCLYVARGWQLWQGPSTALTPDGIRRTRTRTASSTSCRYPCRLTCRASAAHCQRRTVRFAPRWPARVLATA